MTELVFILDRSGSMSGLESDTIGGFNAMLKKQQQKEDKTYVTSVLFNDRIEMIHDHIDIQKVRPLSKKDYYVNGSTALLDAIGTTIRQIKRYLKDKKSHRAIFVIITDGYENASRKYEYEDIEEMIEHCKKHYDWEFMFLGANIDAAREAQRFGIDHSRAVRYCHDARGTALNYEVLNEALMDFRSAKPLSDSWKEKIEKDYQKRSKKV